MTYLITREFLAIDTIGVAIVIERHLKLDSANFLLLAGEVNLSGIAESDRNKVSVHDQATKSVSHLH